MSEPGPNSTGFDFLSLPLFIPLTERSDLIIIYPSPFLITRLEYN